MKKLPVLMAVGSTAILASCFPGKDSKKIQPMHNLPFTHNHAIGEDGSGHGNLKDAYEQHSTAEDKLQDQE